MVTIIIFFAIFVEKFFEFLKYFTNDTVSILSEFDFYSKSDIAYFLLAILQSFTCC